MEYKDKILRFINHLIKDSTPNAPAWNIEHKLEGKKAAWNYIDGCMTKALLDVYYAESDEKYFDFVKQYIDYFLQPTDGSQGILGYKIEDYNCDNINMGKVLFDLYKKTGDDKYKAAIELLMSQLKKQPRISKGNFWHKQIYPNQVWLDGLYMVQPFYMAYEMTFNNKRNYKDIFIQFKNVYEIMREPKSGLYFHGYDESKSMFWANSKTGLSPNFWTRSIGWYAMALVDTLEQLDEQFFYEYETMQKWLKELLDNVHLHEEDNMFWQVTNRGDEEGNYLETSGSCAIAYAFMKGVRKGYLPEYYFRRGRQIFEAIVKNKLTIRGDKFELADICLVAGLGGMPGKGDYKERDGSFEYYISEPRVVNDAKGVAPFLFCFAEMLQKEQKKEDKR